MRIRHLLLLGISMLACFPSHAKEPVKSDSRPNVILILTDDQRFNTISALGNNEIETPNFDKLVEQGISFTHAHIMGGSHAAVCMPSRAMLMTGRALFSLEREGQRIPSTHITIGEVFQKQGYTTCHVGKWHNDSKSHARSFTTAKKIFGMTALPFKTCNAHWHIPVHEFQPDGNYDPKAYTHDPPMEPFEKPYEHTKENGRHSAEVFTDGAILFLKEQLEKEDDKPFFLYLAHIAPHDPRQYPAHLKERYNKETVSLPENFMIQHPFDNGEITIRDELLLRSPRFPDEVKQEIADYYAIISHLDNQIGRLLAFLEKSGLDRNTIIVLGGDNGLALGQHGLLGKQNVYDHSVRIPLIFKGPGIPKNETREQFCYLHDIFPTLCEMLDFDIPETVDSKSLVPCIEENKAVWEHLLFAYRDVQRSIKEGDYKLIEYVVLNKSMYLPKERRGEFINTSQLFNIREDPLEMNNLADDPAYRSRLIELRKKLRTLCEEMNDNGEMGQTFWSNYNPG